MMDQDQVFKVLAALRHARNQEWDRLAELRSFLNNEIAGGIYVPEEANDEYKTLVDQARFNVLRHIVNTLKQALFVDGFRSTDEKGRPVSDENSPVWRQLWQPNRLDARQGTVHRAAISYGYAYTRVSRADPVPRIRPYSPFRCTTLYKDPDDDPWPRYAMIVERSDSLTGRTVDRRRPEAIRELLGPEKVTILDENHTYELQVDPHNTTGSQAKIISVAEHGLGVCPIVRFLDSDDTDGLCLGKVEPLLPVQRQLNQTTFSLLMTQQFESFRQRWVTGMSEETDDEGNVIDPWNPSVSSVWAAEGTDTKFGEFSEANLTGYLESRRATMLFATATGQVPAHSLLIGSGISNISAEALVALEKSFDGDVDDHQTGFGESWEQTIRLGGLALGTDEGQRVWEDESAQVRWREHRTQSFAATVDGLGKLATMLEVPVEGLWERVPGATQQDIGVWKMLREAAEGDLIGRLKEMLDESPEGTTTDPLGPPLPDAPPPAPVA